MNSVKFYHQIEMIKRDKPDMSYMDAVVYYCEENEIEIESVGKFISKTLKEKIIKGTKKQSKNHSIKDLSNIRDNFLIDLLELKKKYKL